MESSTFKSVAFGGFDKQDVVRYIEKEAREHAEEIRRLQEENASLVMRNEELTAETENLTAQAESLQEENRKNSESLQEAQQKIQSLEAETAALRATASNLQALNAEMESLRQDAESYRQFRNRIGNIECEAQKRAAELEAATNASLQKLLVDFRAKYQQLSSTFDVTANHVNNELRKIEVNLSQLPRALDQVGKNLTSLDALLQKEDQEA